MSWKQLLKEAQVHAAEARQLIEEHSVDGRFEDLDVAEKFDELMAQAETKRNESQDYQLAEERQNRLNGMDEFLGHSSGRRTTDEVGQAEHNPASEGLPQVADPRENRATALYDVRFGEMDRSVSLLARDLYGDHYAQKRMAGWTAFTKYLRKGEGVLSGDEYMLLKSEPILTPGQLEFYAKAGTSYDEVKATLVEATDSLGGYVVPEDFRTQMIQRLAGFTMVRPRATVVSTQRDAIEWPKLAGGNDRYTSAVRVTWVSETPTAGTAASNPTFGSERISINTAMIETFLSRNLIEDTAVDLVGLLTRLFAEASAIDEDEQFLIGDGVGKPHGILADSLNTNSLGEVNSGNASAITSNGLISLKRGIARQYRNNAVFIMNSATAEDVELLQDTEGRYRFDLVDDTLLRKPLLEDEAMPDVAADAFPILYIDLGGYVIADRVGMTVERYLDSSTARINQVVYVMRRRLGGKLLEPWRGAVQKVSA